ncbi:SPOR domain-containing protein, partial [Zoogloea sp.]|uniref:SPOR domain-containing protein n=1 Tax=Zoogloea sp. TaxID=49181 RepID=UPI002C98B5C7
KEDTLRGGVAPLAATPAAAPAGAPSAPAVAPQAEVRPPADGRAAPARGYVVQVGGFMEPAAAEDLRARLARGGVPVQLESRVMVGPFADRREALAAQSRLREQGYAPGVIQPSR